VDELLVYTAPKLLGTCMGMAQLPVLTQLNQAIELDFQSVQLVGADLRVLARLKGRAQF
jgi:diaminohydroxyphosphoribosylaminopyrimidine deaminase / 5-amino-6-(5-phosphoribosylamino)uracil reductase